MGGTAKPYLIYFSTLDGFRLPWRHVLALWIIRILSASRIVHCAFGDEQVVLSVGFKGNAYFARRVFAERYRGIVGIVKVYGENVPLDYFEYDVGKRKAWLPTFWRYLRGGAGPWNEDCLCTTLFCLQAAGIPVPYDIATVAGLFRWLKTHGYEYEERRARTPAPRRQRADRPT